MKTKVLLITTILITLFTACGIFKKTTNSTTYDEGVVINGVRWATRNVDEPGTFAPTPESYGKFYQWNRKKAWGATYNDLSENVYEYPEDWNNRMPKGTKWKKINDPSPKGWRVPVLEEIKSLLDKNKVSSEWINNGYKFTDKETGNSIFFPAKLSRYLDGLFYRHTDGYYWSSTQRGNKEAHCLHFYIRYDSRTHVCSAYEYRGSRGLFVRPVKK